jgi:MFS family permease
MDLRPLRNPEYRLLIIAELVSAIGTMVTYAALPYHMYRLTGSSLRVGLLGGAELIALLATAFIGGALADAVDRRRMGLVTDVFLAAGSGTLATLAMRSPSPWMLYLVAAWMSAFSALQRPSMQAIGAKLLHRDEMGAAAALQMVGGSGAMIIGPAIGGIIIANWGLQWAYLFDVASYVASVLLLLGLPAMPPAPDAERPSVDRVIEGFRYARSRDELIGTYIVDFTAMVFGMPLALFPALADRFGGVQALGMLYAAPAVGTMIAGATSRWTRGVTRHGRAVMIAAAVWGLAIVAFGVSRSLWTALFFLALAGGADAISAVFRLTMWNQTIPDALRGRLASIELVSYSSGPLLGHVEAGGVAAAFGITASVISGGVLCVIGVVACGLALPGFTRYDARAWLARHQSAEQSSAPSTRS